jgi:hypothetical protein
VRKEVYETLDGIMFGGRHFRLDLGHGLNPDLFAAVIGASAAGEA